MDAHALIERATLIDGGVLAKPHLLGGGIAGANEPQWVSSACGARVKDEAGRPFLDFLLGFGSVILGHADPRVTEEVVQDIREGVSPTLRKVKELELADLLTQVVPNAEMTIPLKSGSDATSAAVRISRAYTRRSLVVRWGYQGWHDWCAPRGAGIPDAYRELTITVPFNDVDALGEVFARHGDRIAALVVMPADGHVLDREYLHECRRLTDRYGSLFVLDEVRTGFRLALGGAQEYFGVSADLVALSKAMANGHPVSALAGREEVMRTLADVSLSGVFFRSSDGMAAALATIRVLRDTDALETVWARGRQLLDGLAAAAARTGAPVRPVGLPPMPYHEFDLTGEALMRAEQKFYETVWEQGLLLSRGHHWFTCEAMTSEDVRWAIDVITTGYEAVAAYG
ncbi:aminotransferase class III-fold pyridoxal phosphate-dependent enzyme [Saccharothrix australiensis]|uniref:Glutamate-1-semialdehyde 2,1-aminomutase n=1 Tax=Saccharothrix australiensis TaxID=2072 RepID=A0A495W9I8_9PSEU|nr:aminotransferase class III-fold pyridoxal phosphate-dependent enzyme [Saccharothrix australiensis]RKT57780.1 glutamate-1-semialdehyde 2,1-aminomutase [Saccharothrix australiensis]